MTRGEGRYSVAITAADGTVITTIMTWTQVRRYLPGGSEYDTAARVELHRIVIDVYYRYTTLGFDGPLREGGELGSREIVFIIQLDYLPRHAGGNPADLIDRFFTDVDGQQRNLQPSILHYSVPPVPG